MNHIVESMKAYIHNKIKRLKINGGYGRRLLLTIPTLPPDITLSLAEQIYKLCLEEQNLEPTVKIAKVVTNEWEQIHLNKIDQTDWMDELGNLAYYRNLPLPEKNKIGVMVLFGADRVTDAASLADFHSCDLETIWKEQLNESFELWTIPKLQTSGIDIEDTEKTVDRFDRILKPLLEQGRADLIKISQWLSNLNLSIERTATEVIEKVLRSLGDFRLPSFHSFPIIRKQTSFSKYIEKANSFFSYSMFLDETTREKAINAVTGLQEEINSDSEVLCLDDEYVKGDYLDSQDFLAGLLDFIKTENYQQREKLLKCDFVFLYDKILKFKKKSNAKSPKDTIRKLDGSPIEVVLHAVWLSLRDYIKTHNHFDYPVTKVEIISDRFKHDYESSLDGDSDQSIDKTTMAQIYLQRLIGGVDEIIKRQINIPINNEESIEIISKLSREDIDCTYSSTAMPLLEFSVYLHIDEEQRPFRRKFAWKLPEIQSYRLAESIIRWAGDTIQQQTETWKLPVFHLPYYEELVRAKDNEEVRRVLLHSIRDSHPFERNITNLLTQEWLDSEDPLLQYLKKVAWKYYAFIECARDNGLHKALFSDLWIQLRQSLTEAGDAFIQDQKVSSSLIASMLMRAFLIVQERPSDYGHTWVAEAYERSGIVTILHPALLEVLESQITYLFSCFNTAITKGLNNTGSKSALDEKIWNSYVDLASIQSPLSGLLSDGNLNLDTNVRGSDLIHRIGSPEDHDTTLSTRLILQYEGTEDEDISDADLFRECRESMLLYRLMLDYFRLHPHASDGLSLAVYRNRDIQPVISAVHQYLNRLADPKDKYYVLPQDRRKPYAMTVTMFTESADDVDVSRWLDQWRSRWEAAETEDKFQPYRQCRFSVAHRIVSSSRQNTSFQRLVSDSFEADISVLYNFINAGQVGNRFAKVEPFDLTTRTLKFPVLEKTCCSVNNPLAKNQRSRVLTNLQFRLGTLHTEIMARLKHPETPIGTEFVVLGIGDFSPWRSTIDALHKKAEWVICIDPSIDDRLIKTHISNQDREREIIGFGSGVGPHGEANYTISTEKFSFSDIQYRLKESIRPLYAGQGWIDDDYKRVTESVLREARKLSGLSLVRATGVGNYIRDFMAYALVRKTLREKCQGGKSILCDELVSLDAYRHWFDMAECKDRPDLLWLTARLNENGSISLQMRLIECKIAEYNEEHISKAQCQINNGLKVLVPAFAPRSYTSSNSSFDDYRPDQRYWWLQLHRLIASKSEIATHLQAEVLTALERLAEGYYDISWEAAVFAFWTNSKHTTPVNTGNWISEDSIELKTDIYSMGSEFIRQLAADEGIYPLTWEEWAKHAENNSEIVPQFKEIEPTVCVKVTDEDDTPVWQDEPDESSDDEVEIEEDNTENDDSYVSTSTGEFVTTYITEPELQMEVTEMVNIEETPSEILTTKVVSPESGLVKEKDLITDTHLEKTESIVFSGIPERILIGKTVGGNKPVYWEFGHNELANRHMLVFGMSGMGKTYTIQCILCELGRAGQNSLIIDYTDGFLPSQLEQATKTWLNPSQHYIRQNDKIVPLPINPFKGQTSYEEGLAFIDSPNTIAKRVSAIFKSVYTLGDQQFATLIEAITKGLRQYTDSFSLPLLHEILHSFLEEKEYSTTTVRSVMSKIKPFIQENPFSSDVQDIGWNSIFSDTLNRCHVFQFIKVDRHSARALIEFILWDLYAFARSFGNKNSPRVIVLDEVQNLDLGSEAPVAKYLTEGRKFGLSLITATQTIRGVGGVTDQRMSRLFQASQKLFFKPADNELKDHAQLLHNAHSTYSTSEWAEKLSALQKTECWSISPALNEYTGKLNQQAFRIKITSLEERGFTV